MVSFLNSGAVCAANWALTCNAGVIDSACSIAQTRHRYSRYRWHAAQCLKSAELA